MVLKFQKRPTALVAEAQDRLRMIGKIKVDALGVYSLATVVL